MINPDGIKNIIFDFGGVLFEIDYTLPVIAFGELGHTDFALLYAQASQNEIFDRLETGRISNEDFLKYLHSFVPNATMLDVCDAWNCILKGLWPAHVDLVKRLRTQGYSTFLLSNTNAIHVAVFEEMIEESYGLEKFYSAFNQIYYSNKIGIKKPHPETFLEVCMWNDLQPEQTLFIDDSPQHVHGAQKAGLSGHHLTKSEHLPELLSKF
ncbi:MAG: HAD family hydrolase [Flavobacteriales bacterium]